MRKKTDAQVTKWMAEARTGVFRAMGLHRRRLLSPEPMTLIQRIACADLLLLLEEYVETSWVPDMTVMTQQASDRVKARHDGHE